LDIRRFELSTINRRGTMMWGNTWNGGWTALMVIMMIVVAALVIAGIVLLVRALAGANDAEGPRDSDQGSGETVRPCSRALEVLEERYARGEIDQQEFLQRRADLGSGKGENR
jgi:putative membrane protein